MRGSALYLSLHLLLHFLLHSLFVVVVVACGNCVYLIKCNSDALSAIKSLCKKLCISCARHVNIGCLKMYLSKSHRRNHTMPRGRKPPQPTTEAASVNAARCSECSHVWVLRTPRLGRCPGCLKIGTAQPIRLVEETAAA
jgi:hypothetical protein